MTEEKAVDEQEEEGQEQKGPMIKGLIPSLMERGKIKIGRKGEVRKANKPGGSDWQLPVKLDHFLITTLERGPDDNYLRDDKLHKIYGEKPTEISIHLLYDDISLIFPTQYSCYKGRTRWCFGNGVKAKRLDEENEVYRDIDCPCERKDPTFKDKGVCKMNGCLNVLIKGAETVGSVWKFRTTSFNSITGIVSSLVFIKSQAGVLLGLPLTLVIAPKTVTTPTDGRVQTIHVVGLEYKGTMDQLRDEGFKILLARKQAGLRIENIEEEARHLLAYQPDPTEIEEEDVPEWYPEQQNDYEENIEAAEKEEQAAKAGLDIYEQDEVPPEDDISTQDHEEAIAMAETPQDAPGEASEPQEDQGDAMDAAAAEHDAETDFSLTGEEGETKDYWMPEPDFLALMTKASTTVGVIEKYLKDEFNVSGPEQINLFFKHRDIPEDQTAWNKFVIEMKGKTS